MATRTISNAGGNYNAVGTWVEGIIPTNADDVVATATSGNLTVNVASSALSMDFTNYVGTFTVNTGVTLSVYGNIKFVAGMTLAGTGIIEFTANANLTSNGKTFTGSFSFSGSRTLTLLDDARIKGLGSPNAVMTTTINGFSLYTENFTQQNVPVWQGTTNLILNPAVSGNWATAGTGGALLFSNPIQINCPGGNLTISGAIQLAGGGLTHVASSSVNASAATLNLSGTHSVNVGSAVKFGNVNTTLLAGTITLISDLWSLGGASLLVPTLNGSKLYVGGSFGTAFNTNPTGTTEVVLNGSGSISTPNYPNSSLRNPVIVDTAGVYTLTTDVIIGGNFTHISGTVNPNGKTLYLGNTLTLDCAAVNWYNVSTTRFWSATPTYTLNSALNVSNELTLINMPTIFAGTAGFNVSKLLLKTTTTTRTLTLKDGVTYNVTNRFEIEATSNPWTITSSSATVRANLVLAHGAEQLVKNCNATRIDSSAAQTIYTSITRTLTDTINWGLREGSWWPLLIKY